MTDGLDGKAVLADRRGHDDRAEALPRRWASLTGATTAQLGISYLEQGVAALVPYIKADLGLSS